MAKRPEFIGKEFPEKWATVPIDWITMLQDMTSDHKDLMDHWLILHVV